MVGRQTAGSCDQPHSHVLVCLRAHAPKDIWLVWPRAAGHRLLALTTFNSVKLHLKSFHVKSTHKNFPKFLKICMSVVPISRVTCANFKHMRLIEF